MNRNRRLAKDTASSLIALGIPTIIEEMMGTLLLYVDTAMVGHLGEKATASVSLTSTIGWTTGAILYAAGIAIMAMISRSLGERNFEKIEKVSKLALVITGISGLAIFIISISLAPYIPIWMGAEKAIHKDAIAYFMIISTPMLFKASTAILGSAIRATKDTRTPMLINLAANVLNIILNYLLIYVAELGVIGAGIGTAISQTLSGTLMFIVYRRKKELSWKLSTFSIDKKTASECISIAIPSIGTSFISCMGHVFFGGLVASMGTTTFASHSIAIQAEELFYIPGYGLRSATQTLIGISLGEKDRDKFTYTAGLSIFFTVAMMSISGFILFISATPLMGIFTSSESVVSLGSEMLKLIAFSEPFFGLMIVMQGIYWGLGKTKYTFVVELISMWGIRILFTFLTVKVWNGSLREVWYCMLADNIFKAIVLTIPMFMAKGPIESFKKDPISEVHSTI